MARPATSPALVARALALVDGGSSPEAAAAALKAEGERISPRRIYNALDDRKAALPARKRDREPAPTPPIGPKETDLEIVESEIVQVRESLRAARGKGDGARTASLLGELRKLMEARRELRPPPPPTDEDEERRWRGAADRMLRRIEAGLVPK